VQGTVDSGELGEPLRANYYEIVNILSKFLNGPTVPHVRLADLVDGVPDNATVCCARPRAARTTYVTVVSYPGSHVTLLATESSMTPRDQARSW